jgi:hypothetical protein
VLKWIKAAFVDIGIPMPIIGADAADDPDLRLQKSLMVVCASGFFFVGIFWGIL